MIKKPQGYDEAPIFTGEFQQLPKGKYVCIIKQVAEKESSNGNRQLVILYDVVEGDYKGFYQKMFDADKAQNPSSAKWRGVFKQNMDGKGTSWLKGVVTSIERSNNFVFPWDKEGNEKLFANKKFGGVFRRRQYLADDGRKPIVTELIRIRSIDGLNEAEIPDDEMLPDNVSEGTSPSGIPTPDADGFMNIPEGAGDEGIPFM